MREFILPIYKEGNKLYVNLNRLLTAINLGVRET